MDMTLQEGPSKTKVSVSIIGDAFADMFCYLEKRLLVLGGDVRVGKPMTPIAGGSGLNTATHLRSIIKNLSPYDECEEFMDVMLQSAINERDEFGQVILNHVQKHELQFLNCKKNLIRTNEGEEEVPQSTTSGEKESSILSTGHCIVIVTEGERSFVTHLGIMKSFKASDTILHELIGCRSANPDFKNHHHHIHIAGYYNMPGFTNGNLKRRLQKIRERRRSQSHGTSTFTTTTSLVPQYDAHEEWDGGLLEVLPLVDFFILNLLEACKISGFHVEEKDGGGALNRTVLFNQLSNFFWEISPLTHVIVTLGCLGAVALFQGEVIASLAPPRKYENPLDPTGAGDAFAAGFIFGVMKWRKNQDPHSCAEIGSNSKGSWTDAILEGMRYGCATGSACVMQFGACVPSSKDTLEKILNNKSMEQQIEETNESSSLQAADEEYYSEDYDSDYIDDESDYSSEYNYEDDYDLYDESSNEPDGEGK